MPKRPTLQEPAFLWEQKKTAFKEQKQQVEEYKDARKNLNEEIWAEVMRGGYKPAYDVVTGAEEEEVTE